MGCPSPAKAACRQGGAASNTNTNTKTNPSPDGPTLEKEPITPFLDWAIVPLQRDISIVAPHLSRSYSLSTTSGQEIAACATLVAHLVAPNHSRRSQPRPSGARQPSPYV